MANKGDKSDIYLQEMSLADLEIMEEIHICPILMRTIIWANGKCTEICDEEECPLECGNNEIVCGGLRLMRLR